MLYLVIETFRDGDAHWEDLTDFEVIPVVTSAEAAASVAPRL